MDAGRIAPHALEDISVFPECGTAPKINGSWAECGSERQFVDREKHIFGIHRIERIRRDVGAHRTTDWGVECRDCNQHLVIEGGGEAVWSHQPICGQRDRDPGVVIGMGCGRRG